MSTFNHIDEGLIKVIVFDIAGDFIIPNENNDLLKMPFNSLGMCSMKVVLTLIMLLFQGQREV